MTKTQDRERKAARLVAQFQRNRFAGANERADLAVRRVQRLSGAAQRHEVRA